MIVLDTKALSEPVRATPDPRVVTWLQHAADDTAMTAITVGEILIGVRALPAGHRRKGLMAAVEEIFTTYADRILPYDEASARVYAALQETRRAAGQPLSVEDGMIAAICRTRQLSLATRTTNDFRHLGIDLINPWDAVD